MLLPEAPDNGRYGKLVGRIERVTEVPMLVLAVAYVIAFVVGALPDVSAQARGIARLVESLVVAAFAAELIVKVAVARRRLEYLRSHWLDVLIVALPFLRPLRILLVLPVLARALTGLNRVMARYRGTYVLVVGVLTVFVGAGLMAVFEDEAGGPIRSFDDALWWAMTTITTVGYGDTYPVARAGRAVAVVLMVVGIALFGALTAAVAAYFVETATQDEYDEQEDRLDEILVRLKSLEESLDELKRRDQ
jgi:voltage-gated potassium channel